MQYQECRLVCLTCLLKRKVHYSLNNIRLLLQTISKAKKPVCFVLLLPHIQSLSICTFVIVVITETISVSEHTKTIQVHKHESGDHRKIWRRAESTSVPWKCIAGYYISYYQSNNISYASHHLAFSS